MTPCGFLRKDELAVHGDLEDSAARRNDLEIGDLVLEFG
jgi:hypothetical protein